ncbi:MAG: 16S rRNA (guanine(966)-N(2))-methyltransferase RsmD [Acidimicrobiaceae bacterium]|nr:16S rRNA (guanine(966)-N(2))-methyltransferase RsmD [Acidimicrobiaceae bacterium]
MRVLGGASKGKKIKTPQGLLTRPTSARVKKSLFDMLSTRIDFFGIEVLDLFAGSGSLGLEAISRGASQVEFVDSAHSVIQVLKQNIAGIPPDVARASAIKSPALTYLKNRISAKTHYDLVFCDPPYLFDDWNELLGYVIQVTTQDSIIVIESDREVVLPEGLSVLKVKDYGSTVITLASLA